MRIASSLTSILALFTLVSGSLIGCSSSSTTASAEISSTGGSVRASDGTAVDIPAGALSQSTPISISPESNAIAIPGATLVGTAYRFGPEGTQFAVPVTITLIYDPTKLAPGDSGSDVVIMTAPVGSSSYTALATTVVDATHVSATTTHFSDFVATLQNHDVNVDQGASTGDMSMSSEDLSTSGGDLSSMNVDLGSACALAFNSSACTLTGCTTYSLNCAQTQCYCYRLNMGGTFVAKPTPYTNTTTCPGQDIMTMIWTTNCMFP